MQFDPNNKIVKLCGEGMELEGLGRAKEALKLFQDAWNKATTDFEKFIAAHYVARHQGSVRDKLNWDQKALQLAQKLNDEAAKRAYPSLYLNIGKCFEDLNDFENARKNYELALSFTNLLSDDGYGNLIKGGILNGIKRVNNSAPNYEY